MSVDAKPPVRPPDVASPCASLYLMDDVILLSQSPVPSTAYDPSVVWLRFQREWDSDSEVWVDMAVNEATGADPKTTGMYVGKAQLVRILAELVEDIEATNLEIKVGERMNRIPRMADTAAERIARLEDENAELRQALAYAKADAEDVYNELHRRG